MESLESKLDRLSPGQRKEIEDFVDFLLSRQAGDGSVPPSPPASPPPVLNTAPPLLLSADTEPPKEARPSALRKDAGTDDRSVPLPGDEASETPFHEIGGGIHDRLTHDYMDYGQFEHQASPATEAVKKIKRKIIAREEQDKPRHLVDWVD